MSFGPAGALHVNYLDMFWHSGCQPADMATVDTMHVKASHWPDVKRWELPPWADYVNRMFGKLRLPIELHVRFDHRSDMVSMEQMSNFELLIHQLVENRVAGDFVELGCYTGQTTAAIASLVAGMDRARAVHVYDRFDIELGRVHGIRAAFDRRMGRCPAPAPVVHTGDILRTLPNELPEHIAFAHVDLGVGGDPVRHMKLMSHALAALYPRMSPGGVMIFMDYHVPGVTVNGKDSNPGVRTACDAFFSSRPESIQILYGGPCSHAYVRKSAASLGSAVFTAA